jgi:hypothetical protein
VERSDGQGVLGHRATLGLAGPLAGRVRDPDRGRQATRWSVAVRCSWRGWPTAAMWTS